MKHVTPAEAMNQIFSEKARYQRWLDVEAGLARAQASLGIIPKEAADAISQKANVELLDLNKYKEMYEQTGHPMVAMLRLFQPIIEGSAGQLAEYLDLFVRNEDDQISQAVLVHVVKCHD